MKIPESHPNCEGYQKIDKDLVEALKRVEWFNGAMLDQFFSLNGERAHRIKELAEEIGKLPICEKRKRLLKQKFILEGLETRYKFHDS